MVNGVWYKVEEALPPSDYQYDGSVSVEVAVVLKEGSISKGFRYYTAGPNCWAIFDGKDTEAQDSDVAYWTVIPV